MRKKVVISVFFTILFCCAFMWTLVAIFSAGASNVDEKVKFHFLNVNSIEKSTGGPIGSADCIIIEDNVGAKRVITMVDTGDYDSASCDKVVSYCKNLNISKIDNLFITHPHGDHFGGVPAICDNFDIAKCYYTLPKDWSKVRPLEMDWGSKAKSDMAMQALLEKINSDGTGVEMISPDEEGKYYPISAESGFTVYNCLAVINNNYREPEFNDFSMCMKYTYKGINAFLTGDINTQYEYVFTGEVDKNGNRVEKGSATAIAPIGEIQIFKLPHHGTEGSLSTENFFKHINPDKKPYIAVITGYRGNIGASTVGRCEQHGYTVKITHDGDVTVWTDGENVACDQASV